MSIRKSSRRSKKKKRKGTSRKSLARPSSLKSKKEMNRQEELKESALKISSLLDEDDVDIYELRDELETLKEYEPPYDLLSAVRRKFMDWFKEHETSDQWHEMNETMKIVMPHIYHGTSSVFLDDIEMFGLKPQIGDWVIDAYAGEYLDALRPEEYYDILSSDMSEEERDQAIKDLFIEATDDPHEKYELLYGAHPERVEISVRAGEFQSKKHNGVPILLRLPSDDFTLANPYYGTIAESEDFISSDWIPSSSIEIAKRKDMEKLVNNEIELKDVRFEKLNK